MSRLGWHSLSKWLCVQLHRKHRARADGGGNVTPVCYSSLRGQKQAKQQLEKDYEEACRKVFAQAFNLQKIRGFEFEAPDTCLEAFGVIPSRFGVSNTALDAVFVVPATEASAAPVVPYPSADDWEVFMLGPGGWTDAHTQAWGSHTEPRLIVAEVSRPAGQLKAKLQQLKARLALFNHWRTRFQVVLVIVLNGPDQAFRMAQQDVQTSSFNVIIVHWTRWFNLGRRRAGRRSGIV